LFLQVPSRKLFSPEEPFVTLFYKIQCDLTWLKSAQNVSGLLGNPMVQTFDSMSEILTCDRSNKLHKQYFPLVLFIMLEEVVLTFESADEILKCDLSD